MSRLERQELDAINGNGGRYERAMGKAAKDMITRVMLKYKLTRAEARVLFVKTLEGFAR